jgi:uncharacterized protein (DUF362 family)/NAD-dependent dihydropyrimidine dehydrogenase PreA subunit
MVREKVSVVKCGSYNCEEVKKALIESFENIRFKFKKGMKILIKPNLLSPQKPEKAVTTHPSVIEELCKILKEKKARIYIGDSSGYDTDLAFKMSGIDKLSGYGKIVNFEKIEREFFNLGGGELSRVPLPKILKEVDLIINVAKLKTHSLTQVTLCVKNLYGCVPGNLKQKYHRVLPSPERFSELLMRIEEKIKPGLNIIDGVWGLEGEGPGAGGEPIKSKVIIAGRDARAVDIIASELMGFNPNSIYTNKFSGMEIEDIDVIGNGKDIKLRFKRPRSYEVTFSVWLSKLLPKPKIKFDRKKCVRCGICEKKCPVKAITLKPYPECNSDKCIRCLCCIEVCPHDAIYVGEHWLRKILKKTAKKLNLKS